MKFDRLLKTIGLVLLLAIVTTLSSSYLDVFADEVVYTSAVDEIVFPHDTVIKVSIDFDEEAYNYMLENALDEEYVTADITYNGYTFNDIAIRPKGNSSLKSVAQDDTTDRYSFKVDFNYYIDDQNFFGITKLNLNNIYGDASYMREYIGYEALESLGVTASRTTYIELYINDEYYGLYLAVEDVDNSFIEMNYDDTNGVLYKPNMTSGADLVYVDDEESSYPGIYPESETNESNKDIIELMNVLANGGDLEAIFDVDSFLKYLAFSTYTVNLDSYQGGMFHNYYLYNDDGYFTFIPWDLNMIFNGFPAMTDEEAVNFLIDEPVIGDMSGYPLIEAILSNDTYMETYHDYLEDLMTGYFSEDAFNEKVNDIYDMIKDYVAADPTSFYPYELFESKVYTATDTEYSLLQFVALRNESVSDQLDGLVLSTNDGMGNTSSSGFQVGNKFGNVGNAGFDTRGMPVTTGDVPMNNALQSEAQTLNQPQTEQTENTMDERPNMETPNNQQSPSDQQTTELDFQALLLQSLKGLDNLPEAIASYVVNNTLPPKDILDTYLAEIGTDPLLLVQSQLPEGVSMDAVVMGEGPESNSALPAQGGMTQQSPGGMIEDNGVNNNRINENTTTGFNVSQTNSESHEVASYMVVGGLMLMTIILSFIISKRKR